MVEETSGMRQTIGTFEDPQAKELFEMGIIGQREYEEIKNECLIAMGLRKNNSSSGNQKCEYCKKTFPWTQINAYIKNHIEKCKAYFSLIKDGS